MLTYHSGSALETEAIARELAQKLRPDDVLAFRGGMGAGKTTFVRGLAAGLGDASQVSSPTFAIVHEYPCVPKLYHFDMYRIVSLDDLYSTGFFDYLETGAILAIEWSENIQEALPEGAVTISLEKAGEDGRIITVDAPGDPRWTPMEQAPAAQRPGAERERIE